MNLVIIQARMGSSRLPGKVLMDIEGKVLLGQLIDRISPSKEVDKIIVATTSNAEDDAIEKFCMTSGVSCFRGSDWDVLDRFYQAAISSNERPKNIVRICSDNPLHSHQVVDAVLRNYYTSQADYFSNSNHEPDFLEDGFDTEVFSFEALESAWKNAKLLSEREHVCPYIKKYYKCGWKKMNAAYSYKLSVDTLEDLNAVRAIFKANSNKPDFSIDDVVSTIMKHPEIMSINQESKINSGYFKTLNEDRIVS